MEKPGTGSARTDKGPMPGRQHRGVLSQRGIDANLPFVVRGRDVAMVHGG